MAKKFNRALCYAVAKGRQPGIYFTWEECQAQVHGFPKAMFHGFKTVNDARAYLKDQVLEPMVPGEWIPLNGVPILYVDGSSPAPPTTLRPVISIDSSPDAATSTSMSNAALFSIDRIPDTATSMSNNGCGDQAKKPKNLCYAVAKGRQPGIYFTWEECQAQVHGCEKNMYLDFENVIEARAYLKEYGLEPKVPGQWIPIGLAPILYVDPATATASSHSLHAAAPAPQDKKATRKTNNKGLCYAVVKGRQPGIYFTWEECQAQVHGFPHAIYEGHRHISQARVYLQKQGLEPKVPGKWIPINQVPIFYEDPRNNPSSPNALLRPVISVDSSPESDAQDNNVKAPAHEAKNHHRTVNLDAIQQQALDFALDGRNIFLTGVAGTGKSLVTKLIVEQAKAAQKEVAVAAPTGVAAVNLDLGAQTLHSLAGIRVPQRARDFGTMHSKANAKKWRKMEMLVLDEIGMLTADFLDWLDVNVRQIRNQPLVPFGGIQLVFVGDFAQLGPVPGSISLRNNSPYKPDEEGADCFLGIKECTAYAFQSALWREADFHNVHLKTVYRQNDREFVEALMDLRGQASGSKLVQNMVETCKTPLESRPNLKIPDGIRPTVLYCTNWQVDKENYDNLASLNTAFKRFVAKDTVEVDKDVPPFIAENVKDALSRDKFFEQCQASKDLDLKVGAQVMLLQNLTETLVNGSRGVIESFKLVPVVRNSRGQEQLVGPDETDKLQGKHWDDVKWGTELVFNGCAWKVCKMAKYPLVKFMNGQSKIILPTPFERNLYRKGTCKRSQVPLRLCWALTVHKSQGCSLDLVIADLKGCFTSGQAYVALSRARSMPGLQIRNFDSSHVRTDPLVEAFYRALDRNEMKDFLDERAGLWWYPILDSERWLEMFRNANARNSRLNSQQFRNWLVDHAPPDGYKGWKGYSDL